MSLGNKWQNIPGYPDYQFNDEALEVKSLERETNNQYGQERILKPGIATSGYYMFNLCNGGRAKAFKRYQISWLVKYGLLPLRPLQIDHIDGNKENDHWWNLQTLTNRANVSKGCQENGKRLPTGVSWHKQHKKFRATIRGRNGKTKHLGYSNCKWVCALLYQKTLIDVGEFCG